MLKHWIWLAHRPGVSDRLKTALLEHFSDPEEIYYADSGAFDHVEGLSPEAKASLQEKDLIPAEEILDRFHRLPQLHKVFITHREDPVRWPCTFRLSYYTPDSYRTAYMYEFRRKGLLYYRILDEFDFVHWLNTGIIRRSSIFPAAKEAQP